MFIVKYFRLFCQIIFALICLIELAEAQDKPLLVPVSRDTWLSSVDNERLGSNGGASRLKLKSYQEMALVDFDPSKFTGYIIKKAHLHLNVVDKTRLLRITTSSISAPWVEGDATNYAQVAGVSSFQFRESPDKPWSYEGSDLTSVVLGSGNSWWYSADPTLPDEKGWQVVEVGPDVVAARIAGLSHGVLIFDDVGSEWKRDGDKFEVFPFPNRYIYSLQQNKAVAPYFTFELGEQDNAAPKQPANFKFDTTDLRSGEAILRWSTPEDIGPAGTLGFEVQINQVAVPLYLVPRAGRAGEEVYMHLRDIDLNPKADQKIEIRAVDRAGNRGEPLVASFRTSTNQPWQPKTANPVLAKNPSTQTAWPKLRDLEISVIDELDKVDPSSGRMQPAHDKSYWLNNHLWNAATKTISLAAAKKEWIAFQIVVRSSPEILANSNVKIDLSFSSKKQDLLLNVGRMVPVSTGDAYWPDPVVPLNRLKLDPNSKAMFGYHSYLVECHIPAEIAAGQHQGELTLSNGTERLALPVTLEVYDFSIPDRLSFFPEMNAYGLPENELDYYRLAQQHRTVLNRLPYYHNGRVEQGCAPQIVDGKFDWSDWDKRFGPLFDGTAFKDLPRGSIPLECFYLPMFENWPIPIAPNYTENYWAEQALSKTYREQFVKSSGEIAEHLQQQGWSKTIFQFYLNGKNNFKERGWSRSTCPWILDEPAHFQDFDALSWFGKAFHEGVTPTKIDNLVFRTDVSRPQWQRDVLDGLVGYAVVSSALRTYPRHVLDRAKTNRELVVEYGTSNRLDQSNLQPLAWCIDSWTLGINGVLPWQTIGNKDSWSKGDELSLFYPALDSEDKSPIPSIRLKSYRRGQQDVEYLELLRQKLNLPRWAIGDWVRNTLPWQARREGTGIQGAEDAGRVQYGQLSPTDFWMLRKIIASELQSPKPGR